MLRVKAFALNIVITKSQSVVRGTDGSQAISKAIRMALVSPSSSDPAWVLRSLGSTLS